MQSIKEMLEGDMRKFVGDESELNLDTVEILKLNYERNRNHMILVLATDRFLWKHIDAVYKDREIEYYKEYLNSFFKDTRIKSAYSVRSRNYINKVAGIDLWCRKNNSDEPILKLIQKGYNSLYRQFKMGIEMLDLDKYISSNIRPSKKQNCEIDIVLSRKFELYKTVIVAMFLSDKFDVVLTGELWRELMDGYIEEIFKAVQVEVSANDFLSIADDKIFNKVMLKTLNVSCKDLSKCKNLSDLFNVTRNSQMLDIYNDIRDYKKMPKFLNYEQMNSYVEHVMNTVRDTPIDKMVSNVSNLPTMVGLDKDALIDIEIDLNLIKLALIYSVGEELMLWMLDEDKITIDENLIREFFYTIVVLALMKNYKNLTPDLFDVDKEEAFYTVESLKTKLKEAEQKHLSEINKKDEIIQHQIKKAGALVKDLEQAQKEIKRLKKALAKSESEKDELIALREYVYESENNLDEVALCNEEDDFNSKLDFLNSKNLIIFGGHPNWVKKLKELLPEQKYIDVNASSSARLNFLENADLIIVSPKYMSHGLFYKIKEALANRKSVKMIFVDDVNTNFIINKIYNNLI